MVVANEGFGDGRVEALRFLRPQVACVFLKFATSGVTGTAAEVGVARVMMYFLPPATTMRFAASKSEDGDDDLQPKNNSQPST